MKEQFSSRERTRKLPRLPQSCGVKLSFLAADDTKFSEAIQTLLTWIERGEVNRRTANNFYSMIQSANSHIRRLVNEKAAHEKEMEEAKEKFKLALSGILVQCEWCLHAGCWLSAVGKTL